MLSEPSAIYYNTDLLIPPLPDFRFTKPRIIGLYNKLHQPTGYPYENLELQGTPTLSSRRENGRSVCQVTTDYIRIEEENPSMTLEGFVDVVKTVMGALGSDVVPFYLQRCMMRFTAQPHGSDDALDLLARKVAHVYDKIAPFERPPSFFGVRFRFAPGVASEEEEEEDEAAEQKEKKRKKKSGSEADEPAEEYKGFMTLRFESFSKDIKRIWMEVAAQYPDPVGADDLNAIEQNIKHTYDFVTEKAKRFLDQFDKPDDEQKRKEGGK